MNPSRTHAPTKCDTRPISDLPRIHEAPDLVVFLVLLLAAFTGVPSKSLHCEPPAKSREISNLYGQPTPSNNPSHLPPLCIFHMPLL